MIYEFTVVNGNLKKLTNKHTFAYDFKKQLVSIIWNRRKISDKNVT